MSKQLIKCLFCEKEGIKNKEIIEHHINYYKKISVWLCLSCHQNWHQKNIPIGTRKEMFLIDRIKSGKVKGKEWDMYRDWFHKIFS